MDIYDVITLIILCLPIALIVWFVIFMVTKPKRKKEFYETGELRHVYFEKKKIGKVKKETFYYRSGQENKITNWKKGKPQGQSVVFYPTGEKYIESNYDDGKLNGAYIVFSKDGSVMESHTYNAGVIL
jgi:antitoxin component YwqK of YwqJK toxin-antitoxin module